MPFPSGLGEFGLVEDVQELVRLHRVQIEAVAPDELQGVSRFRVVTRGNRNPTFRHKLANGYLKAGELGTTPRSTTSQPVARRPATTAAKTIGPEDRGVTTKQNAAGIQVGSKRLRERHRHVQVWKVSPTTPRTPLIPIFSEFKIAFL